MISIKSKVICILMSFAMTVTLSLAPLGNCSFADPSDASIPDSANQSSDASIPTEKQLESAAPNQLIVTYANEALDIEDTTEVAALDGSPLEDVAESEPNEEVTLSDIGAVDVDAISEQENGEVAASSLVTFEEGTDIQEVSAQLISSPDVVRVQPNYVYELFSVGSTSYYDASTPNGAYKHATNDPFSFVDENKTLNQNYIYTTKVADAWAAGYRSNGAITIAVIDSGPRLDHPDLNSAWDLAHARDFTNTKSANGEPYSDSASFWTGKSGNVCHGTWVSGIIGATANNGMGIAGTSYNAKVLPIKVTNGESLLTSTIVKAYNYLDKLVESGQLPTLKVINLSLGGREFDHSFNASVNHMSTAHNILTVAAAGNYGDKIAMYPADFENTLSVMATDEDFTRAYFSNYGKKDVSAPGTSVTTTIPWSSGWNAYSTSKYSKSGINGTSFSTPIVSGIAALCYSVKPHARFDEVKWAIKSGATSLADIDSTCAPYVNALQAVKNVKNGMGLYEATHTSIESAKVSYIASKTYSGKWIKPVPKVTLGGKRLTKGIDYTISYLNNKRSGKATIVIRATGRYKGVKRVYFSILPKESKVVRLQSRAGAIKVKWKSRASSASGYQIRYSTSGKKFSSKKLKSGKTVTVSGNSKISSILKNLKPKTSYYVQVRAYKKSSGVLYYSKWSPTKKAKTL